MKLNKKVIALAGVGAVFAAGGTWAYFNQTLSAENIFDTGTYHTVLVEDFKPEEGENWEPGATVNKDVTVSNTGTLPVVVRVKFTEKWTSKSDPEKVLYEIDTTINKDKTVIKGDDGNGGFIDTNEAINKFESIFQYDPNDGLTGADVDDSVVKKEINHTDWIYNPVDGYYYYTKVIPGAKDGIVTKTEKILDSVTLIENIDMGEFVEQHFYATTDYEPDESDRAWMPFDVNEEGKEFSTREMKDELKKSGQEITFMKSETIPTANTGYSNADYVLTVTAQTVQATKAAVNDIFGTEVDGVKSFTMPKGCKWVLTDETVDTTKDDTTTP